MVMNFALMLIKTEPKKKKIKKNFQINSAKLIRFFLNNFLFSR